MSYGKQVFKSCQLKEVMYEELRSQASLLVGMEATLHCPKIDGAPISETNTWSMTQSGAYRKLGRTATKTLCESCQFAGLSPTEAYELQRTTARAKMDALQTTAMAEQMQAAYDRGKDIITDSHEWQTPPASQIAPRGNVPELPASPER